MITTVKVGFEKAVAYNKMQLRKLPKVVQDLEKTRHKRGKGQNQNFYLFEKAVAYNGMQLRMERPTSRKAADQKSRKPK